MPQATIMAPVSTMPPRSKGHWCAGLKSHLSTGQFDLKFNQGIDTRLE